MRVFDFGLGTRCAAFLAAALTLASFASAETIYLSNTGVSDQVGGLLSELHLLEIDEATGVAAATLLTTFDMGFADAFACSPDDSTCYVHDKYDVNTNPGGGAFGAYDPVADEFTLIGDLVDGTGDRVRQMIGATFSPGPDGELYMTNQRDDMLYTVDVDTAVATPVGVMIVEGTETPVDLDGADIVFTADGRLYIWTNGADLPDAPNGLYEITLPDGGTGDASAVYLGIGNDGMSPDSHRFTGLAVRENGLGNVVGSNRFDELHEQDRDGNDVDFYALTLDGSPLTHGSGDMHHSFDCFLSVDLESSRVERGGTLGVEVRIVHNRPRNGVAAPKAWIENEHGEVIASKDFDERTFRWGDDLTRRFTLPIPDVASGDYTLWFGVGEMRQGFASVATQFTIDD